jgi:hypothetical protein
MNRILAVGACLMILAGCAGKPASSGSGIIINAAPPDRALVIVYRTSAFDHSARMPGIAINGVHACDLADGHALVREVEPGNTAISTSLWDWPGTSTITVAVERGETYYIRMAPNPDKRMAGMVGGHPGVWLAEALAERRGPFLLDLVPAENPIPAGLKQMNCP